MLREPTVDQLHGRALYGDDMSASEIAEWYRDEENGFFDLAQGYYDLDGEGADGGYAYEYDAFNWFHGLGLAAKRRHRVCLAFGCAAGDDVAPLAPHVDRFIAVEPAEQWWKNEIGGTPATYLKPAIDGDLPIGDDSVDLITALGVLHHIPNVAHVMAEFARVLKPGGMMILREPINSMGDWREPRAGLTAHERGLPRGWLDKAIARNGFRIVRRRYCMFPLVHRMNKLVAKPFDSLPVVMLDWLIATAMSWNDNYWRDTRFKKLAPASIFLVLERAA